MKASFVSTPWNAFLYWLKRLSIHEASRIGYFQKFWRIGICASYYTEIFIRAFKKKNVMYFSNNKPKIKWFSSYLNCKQHFTLYTSPQGGAVHKYINARCMNIRFPLSSSLLRFQCVMILNWETSAVTELDFVVVYLTIECIGPHIV